MTPILSASGITLRRAGQDLLAAVALDLAPGETLGLIGPNGAGKSLLLRVLAALDRPDAGSVTLGGRDLHAIPAADRAALLGYLPQHFSPHWDLRVEDLVQIGLHRAGATAPPGPVLAAHDLVPLRNARWSRLSGGERARALAAAVLAVDPPVLLADEPAAALDVGQALGLMQRLRARPGATVVVLHDLHLAAAWCDRLLLLHHGRVAASGPTESVLLDPALDDAFGLPFQRLRDAAGTLLLVPASGAPRARNAPD